MKRFLIAIAATVVSFGAVTNASAQECLGNCHNFVTTIMSGTWVRTESGGYVHDSSAVCDIIVQFEYDSAELSSEGAQTLLDNLDILMYSGSVGFSNSGFASVEGEENYNLTLSERRAATVYHFLEDNGVDMSLISPVHGFGETDSMGGNLEDNRVVILSFNG